MPSLVWLHRRGRSRPLPPRRISNADPVGGGGGKTDANSMDSHCAAEQGHIIMKLCCNNKYIEEREFPRGISSHENSGKILGAKSVQKKC